MTPKQHALNERIAKALGWTQIEVRYGAIHSFLVGLRPPSNEYQAAIPNWVGDLNEMWGLMEELTENEHIFFGFNLLKILDLYEFHKEDEMALCNYYQIVHATAEQRAEAWLAVREGES